MTGIAFPPGPRGLPLLGTLPALYRDILSWLLDLGHRYGDIAFTQLGSARIYLINEPGLIEDVLVGKHRECVKDKQTRLLSALVGHGLLTSDGEVWRQHRKLAAPPLQPKRIAGYAETMAACSERVFSGFRDGELRRIDRDMAALTLEIAGKTLLGFDTRGETQRIAHVLDVSMAHFSNELHSWRSLVPNWVPTSTRRSFRAAVAELDRMLYAVIARCRNQDPPEDHLLARLVHARDEDGESLTDEQIRDESITMLLAGHETTALALSYAAHLIGEHPPVAQRLREEVDSVIGSASPSASDLALLPYLDAVLRETLRLYPPAFLIGREVTQAFKVGGYAIPRGSEVLMSPWAVQRDPRLYSEPERFAPERWLSPEPRHRFSYFPFGGGPRVCIGNHFAMLEAAIALAVLMQHWELEAVPGFRLRLAPSVTLRPAEGGIPVRIRRRQSAHRAAPDAARDSVPVQS